MPAGAVPEPGETLRDAPTQDFTNTLPKGDSLEDLRRVSPELFWTDAQHRDSQDVVPSVDLDETPTPVPTEPRVPEKPSATAPAEPVRSPSPTVAESSAPGSPKSPGSPTARRGKSPTYFKFLGTGMARRHIKKQGLVLPII